MEWTLLEGQYAGTVDGARANVRVIPTDPPRNPLYRWDCAGLCGTVTSLDEIEDDVRRKRRLQETYGRLRQQSVATETRHLGGLWEKEEFAIQRDFPLKSECQPRCPHCRVEIDHPQDGLLVVPRVLIAINEGGFNSTGVCLDCVLDAVASPETKETP